MVLTIYHTHFINVSSRSIPYSRKSMPLPNIKKNLFRECRLSKIMTLFYIWAGSLSTIPYQAIQIKKSREIFKLAIIKQLHKVYRNHDTAFYKEI